jgi:hypothetical protein
VTPSSPPLPSEVVRNAAICRHITHLYYYRTHLRSCERAFIPGGGTATVHFMMEALASHAKANMLCSKVLPSDMMHPKRVVAV